MVPIKEANLERLKTLILEVESDSYLDQPSRLRQRIEVLDRLEAYYFRATMSSLVLDNSEAAIYRRATEIQAELEAANSVVYATIRRDIRRGRGASSLLRWLPSLGEREYAIDTADYEGYDFLDELIIGVLQFEELDTTTVQPAAEMVFYQPTPARHVFDLLERTALTEDDVLVDIGSGLGHVPMLTSICAKARSVGIELEPAYVDCAQQAAESLNLSRVTFIQQDARSADFSNGTVFYLYTPFTGTMLRATLELLRQQANSRPIRICTFGPCTLTIAAEDWVDAIGQVRPDRISIFQSRPSTLAKGRRADV
jgi:histone methylation protein DOT1